MRRLRRVPILAVLGFCLSCVPAGRHARAPAVEAQRPIAARPLRRPPGSPSKAALQEARRWWKQALVEIKPEMERLGAADPDAVAVQEGWRHRLMSRDPHGYLRQAHQAATRAVSLARSPDETYEATVWQALIECDQGRHGEELQHARRLVALQPHTALSWGTLRRAAKCNGLERLARQADQALAVVTGESGE
jgi:hypothetical protein